MVTFIYEMINVVIAFYSIFSELLPREITHPLQDKAINSPANLYALHNPSDVVLSHTFNDDMLYLDDFDDGDSSLNYVPEVPDAYVYRPMSDKVCITHCVG